MKSYFSCDFTAFNTFWLNFRWFLNSLQLKWKLLFTICLPNILKTNKTTLTRLGDPLLIDAIINSLLNHNLIFMKSLMIQNWLTNKKLVIPKNHCKFTTNAKWLPVMTSFNAIHYTKTLYSDYMINILIDEAVFTV